MGSSFALPPVLLKVLLICGILAALIYIVTDVIASLVRPGYNFVTTTANLLIAHGSPTRSFVLPLNVLAHLLLLGFALGVWFAAGDIWVFRVMACLLAANAILSLLAGLVFPWHPGDAMDTDTNKANLALMASSVVVLFLAVVLGIFANHNWMRGFTIGLIALFLVLAVYSVLRFRLAAGAPPQTLIGVQERTMFYGELIWLILQAAVLIPK